MDHPVSSCPTQLRVLCQALRNGAEVRHEFFDVLPKQTLSQQINGSAHQLIALAESQHNSRTVGAAIAGRRVVAKAYSDPVVNRITSCACVQRESRVSRNLAEAIAAIPIALGERVPNRAMFKNFMQAGAVHFVQVDCKRVAGISEFLIW
jgi:hypothetical protein